MDKVEKKNIALITGYSGFLGSRFTSLKKDSPFYDFRFYDKQSQLFHIYNPTQVFHLAAVIAYQLSDSKMLFENNVELTQKICNHFLEARIVMSSSVSVYPSSKNSHNEFSSGFSSQPYALSKIWAEQLIKATSNYAIVRFSSIFGPGMKESTIIPSFVNQALDNNVIEVWGNGSRRQNYIYIDDACQILHLAMQYGKNDTFLGVGEDHLSNLEVAEIVAKETGAKIKFVKEDNSPSFFYNSDYTKSKLNWKPDTNIEMRIRQYIKWKKKPY